MPIATDMTPDKARDIVGRVQELITLNQLTAPNRSKIRDIMNGGPSGIARLVGKDAIDEKQADLIPAANMMLKAVDRMAQKIGRKPDTKVDTTVGADTQRAREHADKRARALDSWDRAAKLQLQLPQVGRWLPGYGFTPWVIKQGTDLNGDPFPMRELRDPFNAYPGTWNVHQQPRDIAFIHMVPVRVLESMYPEMRDQLKSLKGGSAKAAVDYLPRERGGVVLGGNAVVGHQGGSSWANQNGDGLEVYEYVDEFGTWWVLPDGPIVLSYVPNLMSRAPFVVTKRFAFDRLQGQYDQMVGLMSAQARLSILTIAAAEDAVHAETNVIGDMVAGKYNRGRRAINYLAPGSTVSKMNERIPFEVFQQIDRIERQMRSMATYPVTDDSISPNSFVTEVGLDSLGGAIEEEYREYRLVIADSLEVGDSLCLEYMDTYYPNATFHMEGFRAGASFSDTYRPSTHIKGNYRSRRVYGAMAGFDDANKIVVGSVLQDKGIIDTDTFRDNVDGLEDHARIKERIHNERMEAILYEMMSAGAQQLDPKILNLIVEELPDGDRKELFREVFEPPEEEEVPVEEAGMGGPGAVPDVTTVLNRLTTGSDPTAGVQTVGRSG